MRLHNNMQSYTVMTSHNFGEGLEELSPVAKRDVEFF